MFTKAPSIAAGWHSYRKMAMPPDAPEIQIEECRLAFWAGSAILFQALLKMLDPGEEPTEADLAKMDAISKELNAFAATFGERVMENKATH